jgi:hypothetical protein
MLRWLCLLVAIAGCSSSKEEPKPNPKPELGSAVAPPPRATLDLYVNDKIVGSVSAAQVATWPRIDTLVPVDARRLGKWESVSLKGKADKPTEIQHPSATYPELVPAIFPGDDGKPSYGMFDPVELAKHGKPALREDDLREVRIKIGENTGRGEHESGEGGGSDPTQMKITIKTAKGETIIEGSKLLAIARSPMPGESGEGKGWPLTTILDLGGIKKFDKLLLTDAAGTNLSLEKADFDPKKSVPFVKLNRQGQLRFRVFKKQGNSWQPGGDLRELASIEVLK